jgi:hypothetical protein
MKWIALTEHQLEIVSSLLKANEESLVDLLNYPMHNTDQENAEFAEELTATLDVLEKVQTA